MKIKITGKFKIETDSKMMNNVQQPLELFELEILPIHPVEVNRFKSYQKK